MARKPIPIDLAQVELLASQGHTQGEIARRVGVSVKTLERRKRDSVDFDAAIKRGQEAAHSTVSNALYQQAKKGNVAAIIWYEKTRRGFRDAMHLSAEWDLEYESAERPNT
jgi:hypothetical protein